MKLIETNIINENSICSTYNITKVIPGGFSQEFLKHFIVEKMSAKHLGTLYGTLKGHTENKQSQYWNKNEFLYKKNLIELINNEKTVTFFIQVYYYDSTNYNETNTKVAFKVPYSFKLDELKNELKTDISQNLNNYLEKEALKYYDKIIELFGSYFEDKYFRFGKLQVYLILV